jgi:ABC-type Fe3+/spermidine/putrescine transport system ATPase subunit
MKVDNSGSTIETREGYHIRVAQQNMKIGEKAVVAVRLEDVYINSITDREFNTLSGKLDSAIFIGGYMKYKTYLEDDLTISSKVLISEVQEKISEGETVTVSFHPERCYLFPYPKAGLLKEIEAI